MTEVLTSEDPFSGPSKSVGPVLSATLEVRDFIAPVRRLASLVVRIQQSEWCLHVCVCVPQMIAAASQSSSPRRSLSEDQFSGSNKAVSPVCVCLFEVL